MGHCLTCQLIALEARILHSRPNQLVFTRIIHGASMSPNVPRNKKETLMTDSLSESLAEPNLPMIPPPLPMRATFEGKKAPLFKALAEARKHYLSLTADSEADVQLKGGGGYKHAYADLNTVIKALTPGWLAANLAVVQMVDGDDLITVVGVEDSSLTIACPIPRYDTPQQMGSAVTYIRRYQLKAVFCVNDSEDDDGNAASGNKAQVTRKEPTVAPKNSPVSEAKQSVVDKAKELGLSSGEFGEMVKEHTKKLWKDCNDIDARVLLTVLEAKAVFGKDGAR